MDDVNIAETICIAGNLPEGTWPLEKLKLWRREGEEEHCWRTKAQLGGGFIRIEDQATP